MSADVLEKHIKFWTAENHDPIIQQLEFLGWRPKPYPVRNGRAITEPEQISAEDIDPERLLGFDKPLRQPFTGEFINCLGPMYSEAWMESLIGCPIFASAYSCTAKPVTTANPQLFDKSAAFANDWAQVMHTVLQKAVSHARNHVAVRQLHIRGVIDMIAAYFGEEKLCLLTKDNPEMVRTLASEFSQLYKLLALKLFNIRKPWNDGYVSSWGLFAPGPLLDYQADASGIFSQIDYQQFFLDFDRQIIDAFPYSIFHVHACGIHIIPKLLNISSLRCIEISLDRETGKYDPEQIICKCGEIQKAGKSALIYGQLSDGELKDLLRNCRPGGLAIFYWK